MYKIITPLLFLLFANFSVAQSFEWAKSTGGSSTDHAKSVISDPSDGSIYVTGFFFDTFDADPGTATTNLTSLDAMDLFLLKLDANGDFIWADQIGGTGFQSGVDLAIDNQNNVLVLINNESSMDINKYDSDGNILWTYATDYGDAFWPYALAVDENDDIYFCGTYSDSVDFDNTANVDYLIAPGLEAGFITKISSAGNYIWAQSYGTTTGAAIVSDITIADDQSIYSTGFFHGPVDFDPGIGSFSMSAFGSTDIYTLKLNQSAEFEWAAQAGGTESNQSRNITVDSLGNSYMTGFFDGIIDVDPSAAAYNLFSVGSADFLVQKLDANGNLVWAQSFGGIGYDIPEGIALDEDGYTYITGNFGETADFDPTIGVYDLDAGAIDDGFILKLNPNGELTWAYQIAADWFNTGYDICLDEDNNILTIGSFENLTDLNPLTGSDQHNTAGLADIFVIKMSQPTTASMEELDESINVFPNPATTELFFSQPIIGDYEVFTIEGRKIASGKITADAINVEELAPGLYNIRVFNNNFSFTRQVLIQ